MGDGPVYVYGIARSGLETVGLRGLDGRPVDAVVQDGIAALVSDAGPHEVRTTRDRLLAHARVLEELVVDHTVLPMRFGVVAPSEAALRHGVLMPRRKLFAKLLDRLEGSVEIDVRVFYEEAAILREIVRSTPAVRRLQMSIGNRPAEATYYDRIELGQLVADAITKQAQRDGPRIGGVLKRLAIDSRPRDHSHERMVLNGAFLVKRADVTRFERTAESLESQGRFTVRVVGPMPPYSFVDLEVDPARKGRRSWAS
jgi:hypothetical protein